MSDFSSNSSSIGSRLRAARESRGLQLADIAGTLRIKPQFLEALESDRPEALPTPTHASGFLRSYARYLGVDLTSTVIQAASPAVKPLAPAIVPPSRLVMILPALLVLGGLIILYAIWHWLQAPEPAPIAPPPAELTAPKLEPLEPKIEPKVETPPVVTPAPVSNATPAAAPAPVETPAAPTPIEQPKLAVKAETAEKEKTGTLVVRAVSDAWVQITDTTGRQLYSKLMRTGEVWRAPQQAAGLRLSTGNAGGLVLVRNGEAGAPLGAQAQVLRNLPLTESAVKPAPAAKPVPAEPASAAADTATDTPDIEE